VSARLATDQAGDLRDAVRSFHKAGVLQFGLGICNSLDNFDLQVWKP